MKKIIFIGGVVSAALLWAAYHFLWQPSANAPAETAAETRIIYENRVVETIDQQLKNLPLEAIRKKAPLIMEKSIADIQTAVAQGELTYTELTAFYLDRIRTFDKGDYGLNAIIEINPQAIATAQKLDAEKPAEPTPLYGIPVLLKDNINTKDMPTSGGTFALKDFYPPENARVVDKLLENHALILGKTNLSELANYFALELPNGYSSKIGQTHNPFDPTHISPLGSSSGSGAAVAANLCAVALGTETTGSIIAPAYIHSLVGFKPTKDVISTAGVLPLSSTMDTVGPMTKTVADAVQLFNAAVTDPANQIRISSPAPTLSGMRIGVFKTEDSDKLVAALKEAGAMPIEIALNDNYMDNEDIMLHDFKTDFANYAQKYNAPVKTLNELVKFNEQDLPRRAKYGQGLLKNAAAGEHPPVAKEKVSELVTGTQQYVQDLMSEHKLEAIAFVNDSAAAIPCTAGYPEITIPLGENRYGEPMGATFFARAQEDEKLVNIAYAFEQATQKRLLPEKYQDWLKK